MYLTVDKLHDNNSIVHNILLYIILYEFVLCSPLLTSANCFEGFTEKLLNNISYDKLLISITTTTEKEDLQIHLVGL